MGETPDEGTPPFDDAPPFEEEALLAGTSNACSAEQTNNCAKVGCGCIDSQCAGGYCPPPPCAPKKGQWGTRATSYGDPGGAKWVATNGLDPADCASRGTLGAPYRTVGKALACVAPGGSIVVRGGTYTPAYHVVTKPVHLRRYLNEQVVFTGADSSQYAIMLDAPSGGPSSAGSTVRGITFQHYKQDTTFKAPLLVRSSNVTVEDCTFKENAYAGLTVLSHDGRVANNVTVRNNLIQNNGVMGLHMSNSQSSVVENNVISGNNTTNVNQLAEGGFKADRSTGLKVRRNMFFANKGAGLWLDIQSENSTIVNNELAGNTGSGFFFEISNSATIASNRFYSNGGGVHLQNSTNVKIYSNSFRSNGSEHLRMTDSWHRIWANDGKWGQSCKLIGCNSSPMANVEVRNNAFSGSRDVNVVYAYPPADRSADEFVSLNYNAYYSGTTPPWYTWSSIYPAKNPINYSGLSAVRAAPVSQEANGRARSSADYLDPTMNRVAELRGAGVALPAAIASAVEVATSCNHIGAMTWQ
jgi:parallel beta-helix repeat protein